jgi:hypothetical protein
MFSMYLLVWCNILDKEIFITYLFSSNKSLSKFYSGQV